MSSSSWRLWLLSDTRTGLDGGATRIPRPQQSGSGRAPKITPNPSHSAIFDESPGECDEGAPGITEAGKAKIGGAGGEDADGKDGGGGREQRVLGHSVSPIPYLIR